MQTHITHSTNSHTHQTNQQVQRYEFTIKSQGMNNKFNQYKSNVQRLRLTSFTWCRKHP